MFKEYTDGKKTIKVTPKAYEVLYKTRGFKKLDFINDIEEAYELAIEENNIRSLEVLKVDELKELAKEKEIEGYSKMKKEELIEALRGE